MVCESMGRGSGAAGWEVVAVMGSAAGSSGNMLPESKQ